MKKRSESSCSRVWSWLGALALVLMVAAVFLLSGSRVPRGHMLYERGVAMDTLIYAMKRYEKENGRLPPLLSSLVPNYIKLEDAGVLFGPTNYPQFVNVGFRRVVRNPKDVKAADTNGPYAYLGHTNHPSEVLLFEKPNAWKSYPSSSKFHDQLWVVTRGWETDMIPEQRLRDWGLYPSIEQKY